MDDERMEIWASIRRQLVVFERNADKTLEKNIQKRTKTLQNRNKNDEDMKKEKENFLESSKITFKTLCTKVLMYLYIYIYLYKCYIS